MADHQQVQKQVNMTFDQIMARSNVGSGGSADKDGTDSGLKQGIAALRENQKANS